MSAPKVKEFSAPHVEEERSPTPSCFDQISYSPILLNNGYRGHYGGGWPAYNGYRGHYDGGWAAYNDK
jgi:hypothetical protein